MNSTLFAVTLLIFACGVTSIALGMMWLLVRRNRVYHQLQHLHLQLQLQYAQLQAATEKDKSHTEEKLHLLENNKNQLKQEFENLAQHIFDHKQQQFSQQSQKGLDALLLPFKEQLESFRNKVDYIYSDETKERASLKTQLSELQKLNQRITDEAAQLTRALKGEKKLQGCWGEFQLERLLELSGLKVGVDYATEVNLKTEDAMNRRPDCIIYLPEGKHIVIDSKVSLNDYVKYVNAETDEQKSQALQAHLRCLQTHVKNLSEKDYAQLEGLRTPDFVLMFLPIEAAYLVVIDNCQDWLTQLLNKRIVVVTPSTLLAVLNTIAHLWTLEKQNQNAKELIAQTGRLYDKFCVFLEKMSRLGDQLKAAQKTYEETWLSLKEGRGSLISQTEKLRHLGVRTKKRIPDLLIDHALLIEEDETIANEE